MASSLDLERTRTAVHLVMHDVEAVLGKDVLHVIVESGDDLEAALKKARPSWPATGARRAPLNGYVLKPDGSGIGLASGEGVEWESYVVRVSDVIQEALVEGSWLVFPPCPGNPGIGPMNAEVISGRACWVCRRDHKEVVPIGAYPSNASNR